MIKKIIEVSAIVCLMLFSFYYTEKASNIVEQSDPIMKQIKANKKNYEQMATDATINQNYIIPGYAGLTIDLNKSFQKMKQYGNYNESLLVFEEVKPTISINDYYDKYILSGNGMNHLVSLVFKVNATDDISQIQQILQQYDARATFFIDGVWFDNHTKEVVALAEDFHEVEILSYDHQYDELLFLGVLDRLQMVTNIPGKYCYAEYDQKEVLELCSKEKMHTVIPTIVVNSNAYSTLKGNIHDGSIISFAINENIVKELPVVLQYIKQRGYVLDTLDNLLNEGRSLEK